MHHFIRRFVLLGVVLGLAGCCRRPPDINQVGGFILVYEVDRELLRREGATKAVDFPALCDVLTRRLSQQVGYAVVVQPRDDHSIEVILPGVSEEQLPAIKELIAANGLLEFLIVANEFDHADLIEQALESDAPDVERDGQRMGRWVRVRLAKQSDGTYDYSAVTPGDVLRGSRDGEIESIDFNDEMQQTLMDGAPLASVLSDQGFKDVEALVVMNPRAERNVTGAHLASASPTTDYYGNPAVSFRMSDYGAKLLGRVTSRNQPDGDHYRRFGIIIDGELISAPRLLSAIDRHGQITGNFTQQEVETLATVLNAGRLPVPLKPTPVSEQQISPP